MAFIDEFKDMMTDTVIWHPAYKNIDSRDDFGVQKFGKTTEFAARLVKKSKLVRAQNGDEVVSTAHIWIAGSPDISPIDKIELSDGSKPVILSVERFQDELGPSHTKVFFR